MPPSEEPISFERVKKIVTSNVSKFQGRMVYGSDGEFYKRPLIKPGAYESRFKDIANTLNKHVINPNVLPPEKLESLVLKVFKAKEALVVKLTSNPSKRIALPDEFKPLTLVDLIEHKDDDALKFFRLPIHLELMEHIDEINESGSGVVA